MDQQRDEPLYATDRQGAALKRNPFKDLRVRQAISHAIDVKTLISRVMRGYAEPAAIASIPGLAGYASALDVRPPFDLDRAKRLMADAGWGDGFKVSLLCPNNRYVNDTQVCRALASMLGRLNVDVTVDSVERNLYFSRLLKLDTSFYLIGLTSSTIDTFDLLQSNLMTRKPPDGQVNFGQWSSPQFDALVNQLKTEVDPAKRQRLYHDALRIARDEAADLRLYHQTVVWAMRKNVDAHLRSDNFVNLKWVTVR
jgi:peptide/nickel transport system substrate-binding protein